MKIELIEKTLTNYQKLTNALIKKHLSITTMESCTSGLIATLITNVDNSSSVFKGSAITYSNEAKISQGVDANIIDKYGVYSKETSIDMAKAIKKTFKTDIAIGVIGSLGIADPNNVDSVPGEVYFTIDYLKPYSYFIKVNNQGSKFLNKMYVANCICLELLKLLND